MDGTLGHTKPYILGSVGHAFSTTPEFWLNLQSRYELDIAASQVKQESIRSADAFARELVHA
jgi:plasmid maintenance system antidote protein VapI